MTTEIEENSTRTNTEDKSERNGVEKWFKSFSEIDLTDSIVGDSCLDWSDNRILIAAQNSAIICEMGSLKKPISGRPSGINFSIENIFTEATTENPFDSDIHKEMEHFNQARLKSSNTAASPDFEIYNVILNPTFPDSKTITYKGFKNVQVLPRSGIFDQYIATLSLNHNCKIYKQERNLYVGVKWVKCADISKLLVDYISTNKDGFDNDPNSSKLNKAVKKKLSTCITTLSWSNIMSLKDGQIFALLATCIQNGTVLIWKVKPRELSDPEVSILQVVKTDMVDISSVSFRSSDKSTFSIAVGGFNGEIYCYTFILTGASTCKESNHNVIWKLRDRLNVKKIKWFLVDKNNSLLIGCKSHVIFAFKLNEQLQVIEEAFVSEGFHQLPIKDICFCDKPKGIEFYSCSENGQIVVTNATCKPSLVLNCSVFSDSNEYEHNQLSIVFHGIKLSPNNAFLAFITSKPKIVSSVQVKNTGMLSCRRIISPADAASLLISAANSDQSLCNFMDLFEIHRQYFMINHKFVDVLEEMLAQETDLVNLPLVQLQFRWFLWKIKVLTLPPDVARNTFASFDNEAKTEKQMTTELSKIEICLLFRRMILVLQKWLEYMKKGDLVKEDQVLPVYDIVTWVKNKSFFINDKQRLLIQEIENCNDLAGPQTCVISFTKTQFDETGRFGVSENGSKWPLCCLTFQLIQSPAKRKCELSGLFAKTKSIKHSNLMNDLLSSNCIFSELPLL